MGGREGGGGRVEEGGGEKVEGGSHQDTLKGELQTSSVSSFFIEERSSFCCIRSALVETVYRRDRNIIRPIALGA